MGKAAKLVSRDSSEATANEVADVSPNQPDGMQHTASHARAIKGERFIDLAGSGKGMYGDDVAKYIDELRAEWD